MDILSTCTWEIIVCVSLHNLMKLHIQLESVTIIVFLAFILTWEICL